MDTVTLNGKEYAKARSVARELGYTSDYIGQLCRSGKIDAELVGRSWYVDVSELKSHKASRYGTKGTKDIKKNLTERQQSGSGGSEFAVPVTPKGRGQSVNFKKHIFWNTPRYEIDENELMPAVQKEFTTGGGIKITVKQTDAEKVKVKQGPGASYQMSATNLPEISLNGTLKVDSVEEDYNPPDMGVSSQSDKTKPAITESVVKLSNPQGVVGMKRPSKPITVSKAGSKRVKTASSFITRVKAQEIPVQTDAADPPQVIEVEVSLAPYVVSAVVLAIFTLVMMFGLNAVITTSEVATSETLDFNLASLLQLIFGAE